MRHEEGSGGGHRHGRLQQLLEEELSALVRDEVTDPRLEGARVAGVTLSVDYRAVKVRYVLDEDEPSRERIAKADRGFERATPFLRARLREALDLKRLPELNFTYDRDAQAEARAAKLMEAAATAAPAPRHDEEDALDADDGAEEE